MGIYDRDYYRREGPSFLGAIAERGKACKWLIGINVVCFVLQAFSEPRVQYQQDEDGNPKAVFVEPVRAENKFTEAFLLDADQVLRGQVWRLLTGTFLHANLMHIVFNMLFLWWLGGEVEDVYGHKEFLAFYLTSAVLSSLVFVVCAELHLNGPRALGASGAVMAVTVLCAMHFPTKTVLVFFMIPMQIWLMAVLSVAWDAFQLLTQVHTGIGVSAHLGGAAFGFLYYKQHWRVLNWVPSLQGWRRQLSRPKLRVYREEPRQPVAVTSSPSADVDEQLEAKLDAVLEKVAKSGRESLTESENQILMRASEIYKRKRT